MSHRLESEQGILGPVSPGMMCPIHARSVPSGEFPVTPDVGTPAASEPSSTPRRCPGQLCRGAGASWTRCSCLGPNRSHGPSSLWGTHSLHHTFLPVATPPLSRGPQGTGSSAHSLQKMESLESVLRRFRQEILKLGCERQLLLRPAEERGFGGASGGASGVNV